MAVTEDVIRAELPRMRAAVERGAAAAERQAKAAERIANRRGHGLRETKPGRWAPPAADVVRELPPADLWDLVRRVCRPGNTRWLPKVHSWLDTATYRTPEMLAELATAIAKGGSA